MCAAILHQLVPQYFWILSNETEFYHLNLTQTGKMTSQNIPRMKTKRTKITDVKLLKTNEY